MFVVMVFSAMLILLFALLAASGRIAVSSVTDSFGRLWGRSILAEYDLNLKARYGLFGYYGNAALVEDKLQFYGAQTFGEKDYIDYNDCQCSLTAYCLADPTICKTQMMKAALAGSEPMPFAASVTGQGGQSGGEDGKPEDTFAAKQSAETGAAKPQETGYGFRRVRNRSILAGLPSGTTAAQPQLSAILDAIKQGKAFSDLVGSVLVDRYIFTYFKDYRHERSLGETYFRNEIEYILTGIVDDEQARKGVRRKLLAMRNALNLFYLYSCPEKKEAALALATALTPGPEAVVTQGILLEAWALAEAANDLQMLYADQTVPLLKKEQNWALTLQNAVGNLGGDKAEETPKKEGAEGNADAVEAIKDSAARRGEAEEAGRGYIAPPVIEGKPYDDYLRLLLCCIGEDTRILRAMDIIQINMKYLYCDYFLLSDYYTGLRFSLTVDGKAHTFEECYEADDEKTE